MASVPWILACCLLGSCGGDGVLDSPGDGILNPPRATFREVQDTIFTPSCAIEGLGCHAGPHAPENMSLSEGQAYASIVNVPTTEISGYLRVEPGNAADSYVFMKVVGDSRIVGERMPLLLGPLSAEKIDLLRRWIEDGAPQN